MPSNTKAERLGSPLYFLPVVSPHPPRQFCCSCSDSLPDNLKNIVMAWLENRTSHAQARAAVLKWDGVYFHFTYNRIVEDLQYAFFYGYLSTWWSFCKIECVDFWFAISQCSLEFMCFSKIHDDMSCYRVTAKWLVKSHFIFAVLGDDYAY